MKKQLKEGGIALRETPLMKREPIINFEGISFDRDRRGRLLKSRQWQVRRRAKNQLGVARSVRTVFESLFGF